MSAFVGPVGALVEIGTPPMRVGAARPSVAVGTLHGLPRVFTSPAVARSWSWERPWLTDDEVAKLQMIEQQILGPGPYWFLDPVVLRSNMLRPEVAAVGHRGVVAGAMSGLTPAGPVLLEDGTRIGCSATGEAWRLAPLPVLPGRAYTFVGHADASASLTARWLDADGEIVGSVTELTTVDGSSPLSRVEVRGVAPSDAAQIDVEAVAVEGTRWAGFLLVEGMDGPAVWRPGEGIPRVRIVGGLQQVYQLADRTGSHRDVAFQLVEVQ